MANNHQYFDDNTELASEIKTINFYFMGKEYRFFTDNGVFSKGGIDFGSSLLLRNIQAGNYKTILDVGCGYGPMGIICADRFKDSLVTMVDINERAMNLAKQNAIQNGVSNVLIKESFVYQNVTECYDMIISNPPIRAGKEVVNDIILNSINHLNVGGVSYFVIQKKQGAESAIKRLKEVYQKVDIVDKDKGYNIIKCTK